MVVTTKHFGFFLAAYAPGAPIFDGLRPETLDRPLQQMHHALHTAIVEAFGFVVGVLQDPTSLPGVDRFVAAMGAIV